MGWKYQKKLQKVKSNGKKDWIDAVKITVTPYMSGTVNHAMMDETAMISIYHKTLTENVYRLSLTWNFDTEV